MRQGGLVVSPAPPPDPGRLPEPEEASQRIAAIEAGLDPAHPELSGVKVLAYGEISATLILPDPLFDGVVAKRMTGFPDTVTAAAYIDLVEGYCLDLAEAGVSVVQTSAVPVPRSGRAPAVYLLQPQLSAEHLGNFLLGTVDDAALTGATLAALSAVDAALSGGGSGQELAVDGQLSNWWFGDGPDQPPTLIDVGTPFVRRDGVHQLQPRIMLAAVPPGVRSWYLWRQAGEKYMDDYFDRRLVGLDLLGNFIKEGASERIPVGLDAVNEWLAGEGPVSADEVQKYYDDDAATLELFLRARRADRWLRTKALRGRYDFVLPGRVNRG